MTDGDGPAESPRAPEPVRPLDYVSPVRARDRVSALPAPAGYAIGFGVYLAVGGLWWWAARATQNLQGLLCGLAGVPIIAMVVAAVLQETFHWKGILAGVTTAFGLSILIGCLGIAVLCGFR